MSKIRPSAGVIPLRRTPQGWRIFLIMRGSGGRFFPGFHAFPGGGAEPGDEGDPRRTAVRELREETALVARPEELLPGGVRITPAYAPIRYRAEFFVWECPSEQEHEVQLSELESGAWWRLDDALEAWRRAELFLAAPTSDTLLRLQGTGTLAEASARLAAAPEHTEEPIPVLPGLSYYPLPTATLPPAAHTLMFVLGEHGRLLVDPGSEPLPDVDEVQAVVLTHHHPDHVGGVGAARRRGWPIWAHPATARALGLSPDRALADGDLLPHGWQALHTPGHAPGHLALWHAERQVLLCGDLASGLSSILIHPPEGNMADYLASLRRCIALEARLTLPSHGGPFGPGSQLLGRTLQHRLAREAKIERALDGTLEELLGRAYDDVTPDALPLARLSLQAHLEKLVAEGRATFGTGRYSGVRCEPA